MQSQCPHNSGQFQQKEIEKVENNDYQSQCPHNSGQFQPQPGREKQEKQKKGRNALTTRDNFNYGQSYEMQTQLVAMPSQLGTISTKINNVEVQIAESQCPHNSGQFQPESSS